MRAFILFVLVTVIFSACSKTHTFELLVENVSQRDIYVNIQSNNQSVIDTNLIAPGVVLIVDKQLIGSRNGETAQKSVQIPFSFFEIVDLEGNIADVCGEDTALDKACWQRPSIHRKTRYIELRLNVNESSF